MRRPLHRLALALVLTAAPLAAGCPKGHAPAGPRASDQVTLPVAPRTVGIAWTKTDDTSTELDITAGEDTVRVGGTRHHRTDSVILAVSPEGLVTKVRVTYVERTDRNVGPGVADAPSALVGKAYVVWVEGDAVAATTADGDPVTEAELGELTADQTELGKPPVLEQLMARTWKLGERVELTAAELDRIAAVKGSGPRATAMSFTLTRSTADDAEFALTMKMEDADRGMAIDVSGTTVIDARSGRPRRVDLTGPVSGSVAGMPVAGSMKSVITYTFAN